MNKLQTINEQPCIVFDTIEEMQAFLTVNTDYKHLLGTAVYREVENV